MLGPGDRLPTEQQLAAAHGVSRTVVREAVHQLKSQALVRSRQGSGVFVAPPPINQPLAFDPAVLDSVQAVVHVVEVRRVLEGEIAALAAERATRAQIAALRRALKAIDTASPQGRDGVAEDLAFHRVIGEATGNPQFRLLLGFLEQYLREGMRITRGNEARRARFHGGGAARAPRHLRRHRRARPGGGATPCHRTPDPRRAAAGRGRNHRRPAAQGRGACRRTTRPRKPSRRNSMKLMITGGGGFVGARLARALLARGTLAGERIERMVLTDIAPPPADLLADARVRGPHRPAAGQTDALRTEAFDGVFHLASAVSGECEADFELGLRSNLDSTRALLDALRANVDAGGKLHAPGVLQLGRGVRARPGRAAAQAGGRRHAARAADLLRHAEADLRAPGCRLHAQGLSSTAAPHG